MPGQFLARFALISLLLLLINPLSATAQHMALYREGSVRKLVIQGDMPKYPEAALIDKAEGDVIVAVVFNEEGELSQVKVLLSPHPSIEQAVLDALKHWRVEPRGDDWGLHQIASWLSFSFIIKRDGGHTGYMQRGEADYKPDKRYVHPFAPTNARPSFCYMY